MSMMHLQDRLCVRPVFCVFSIVLLPINLLLTKTCKTGHKSVLYESFSAVCAWHVRINAVHLQSMPTIPSAWQD